jgi:hypothetical protein
MKQPIETNGRHGFGVSTTASPASGDMDDFSKYVDIETVPTQAEEQGERARRKRGKVISGLVVLATLVLAAGIFFWMTAGAKKKIDLPVRDRSAQTDQGTSRDADDVTAQAIAEIRAASTSPTSASSPAPSTNTTPNASSAPVTIPLGGTVTTVEAAPATNAGQTAGTSSTQQLKSAGVVSERNPERSIRCAPVPKPVAASNQTTTAAPMAQTARGLPDVLPPDAEKPVALPTFGAMLPVRTLGAIYTLRPSLTRLELTREVRGQGWLLKKGTVLIGRQQGSENDRAYITLVGFIDPASGRLVKLAGDVLGADGAPGLRGKRRQISSRWARVLGRAANAAVSLGQAALTRGGGVNVYLPNAVSPELQSFSPNAISRREFVEVTAGAAAYALVTDLPKEAQGVAPQPTEENQAGSGTTLSDEELANLLSAGSPEQIRAALPRMTPELRQIAEAVLKEQDR